MMQQVERTFAGRRLRIETGRMAKQAAGSAVVQFGDTMVIATVTVSDQQSTLPFFPLTVEYKEKTYAAGKIPGGFIKREGRPHDDEILSARIIDRSIRPLFPEGFKNEVQVFVYVISADQENDADVPALLAVSLALNASRIPFLGPIAGVRLGRVQDKWVINPTFQQLEYSEMDVIIAGSKDSIVMVEGGALEVSEEAVVDGLGVAQKAIRELIALQEEMLHKVRVDKMSWTPLTRPDPLVARVRELAEGKIAEAINRREKHARVDAVELVKREVIEALLADFPDNARDIADLVGEAEYHTLRRQVLESGERVDGRGAREVRPITIESGLLPMRGTSRREIGHGNLAERALQALLPPFEDFPYTIRIVSDILESNGSSSMASVCGGSLALFDAGVPIRAACAGVAMGLIKEGDKYAILTDILGTEDHLGDMDFKVAGTDQGITSIQMDIKVEGLDLKIMREALAQAREGRLHILGEMAKALAEPRADLSPYAPRIVTIQINPEKIGDLIGPKGKTIRGIQEETGAEINVDDSGLVTIAAVGGEPMERAREMVRQLTAEPIIGDTYEGTVKSTTAFGAFVEIMPGTEGLVHISELQHGRTERTEDVVKRGDRVKVKLLDRDERGRLRLSMKALLPKPEGVEEGGNGGGRGEGRERGGRPPRRDEPEHASVAAQGSSGDAPEEERGVRRGEREERGEGGRPRRGRGGRSRR
jgi:polyribonucleotide nucleotidyltransferase